MKTFNQHITEGRTQTLTVLFNSDEQMMQRTYERHLKLASYVGVEFKKLYKHTKYIPKAKSFDSWRKETFKGFEVVFKGERDKLEIVIEYILGTLDLKNKIFDSWEIK